MIREPADHLVVRTEIVFPLDEIDGVQAADELARRAGRTVRKHSLSPQSLSPPPDANWSDIGDDAINITRAVELSKGRAVVVDDLKTAAARRTIELPPGMAEWVAEHRQAQIAERLAAPSWIDERLVFTTPTGNVLSPTNVRRQLIAICERAGVSKVKPNELRHSCASLLSNIGVPNESIADLLGHTTTRMVDTTYRHRLRPVVSTAAEADWTASELG